MIIDVTEEQFFKIKGEEATFFYTESEKGIMLFFTGSGFILRSFHKSPNEEQQQDEDDEELSATNDRTKQYLIWKQERLAKGIRALKITLKEKVEVEARASPD